MMVYSDWQMTCSSEFGELGTTVPQDINFHKMIFLKIPVIEGFGST
jgi:hypothetical protein